MSKEQKQIIILSVLLLSIVGVLIYFNIDRLKPRAKGSVLLEQPTAKLQFSTTDAKALFLRQDYKNLKEFGSVPVKPTGIGVDNPFKLEETKSVTQ